MTPPRILVKTTETSRMHLEPAPEVGWYLLGGIGFVFAVVAAADLVLAWYPLALGNAEWEFGTVTTVLNGLPLFAMGLGLGFAAAVARGRAGLIKFWSVIMVLLSFLILALLALYARNIPAALASVTDEALKVGIKKAILRTVVQGLSYPVAFLWTGWLGWKHARSA